MRGSKNGNLTALGSNQGREEGGGEGGWGGRGVGGKGSGGEGGGGGRGGGGGGGGGCKITRRSLSHSVLSVSKIITTVEEPERPGSRSTEYSFFSSCVCLFHCLTSS